MLAEEGKEVAEKVRARLEGCAGTGGGDIVSGPAPRPLVNATPCMPVVVLSYARIGKFIVFIGWSIDFRICHSQTFSADFKSK